MGTPIGTTTTTPFIIVSKNNPIFQEKLMSNKKNFKIVLLGEGRVGKTSLTLRFIKDLFDEHQQSTIQATYLQKDLKVGDQNVCLSVWDTAGQEVSDDSCYRYFIL